MIINNLIVVFKKIKFKIKVQLQKKRKLIRIGNKIDNINSSIDQTKDTILSTTKFDAK